METIKCAAIQYKESGSNEMKIVTGYGHSQCMEALTFMEIYNRSYEKEGFITNTDRFVDRVEALEIARKAGQLKDKDEQYQLKSYQVEYSA